MSPSICNTEPRRRTGYPVGPWAAFFSFAINDYSSSGTSEETPEAYIKHDHTPSACIIAHQANLQNIGNRAKGLNKVISRVVIPRERIRENFAPAETSNYLFIECKLLPHGLSQKLGTLDIDFDKLKEEYRSYLASKGQDLDALLDAASVHFQSPTPEPRKTPFSEDELEQLLEEDKLLFDE